MITPILTRRVTAAIDNLYELVSRAVTTDVQVCLIEEIHLPLVSAISSNRTYLFQMVQASVC